MLPKKRGHREKHWPGFPAPDNKETMSPVPQPKSEKRPLLIEALQGKATSRPPFWFMRQAGRYLPEYRRLRQEQAGIFPEARALRPNWPPR